jgi:cell division protein FtsN
MQAKNVLYAAVGAPVVAVRKVSDQVSTLKGRFSEETSNYTKVANKTIDEWATEGEKLVSGIREGKVVEEISQKVDLDQAKEQVSKLRDQLEDMLATWRQSFRPEKTEEATPEPKDEAPASKPVTKKPVAKTPAAKKPAAKTSAAKTTKSSTAAKTSTGKSTASKAKSAS